MMPLLEAPTTLPTTTEEAAAIAIHNTGQRLTAPEADIHLALDSLFTTPRATITDKAARR